MNVERSASASVDAANPWPGLAAFTEEQGRFFYGRDKETEELFRLVRRQTLTVLFGQSGLGKSSLLQAGVFPRLRESDFLPLYLRLNHDPSSPSLADQAKAALTSAFQLAKADAPVPRADESLWEYFHRKDIDIWSAKNRLLTPVLAFDQFEEIFTLGRADDIRRDRGAAFLSELADLVENRPPAALRARFDAGELDPASYNFDKPCCQVVLTLREDFLPDLEGLKNEMPSILTNRMRIRRLTGTQALEIVTKPAPHLLAEGVAERVVEFVAGARGGSAERLAEIEVEPALLSVICRELNERRRSLGHDKITADLVTGNRREILNDFYERSVADLPAAMREFVEDHLLTKSGFRDNFALETALEIPGVTRELIDTLVSRRLLRIEEHLGVPRVELAHDVLAEVVRASRDTRQQRVALKKSRRHTLQLRALAAGLAALLAGATWIAWRAVDARRAEAAQASRTDFMVGSRLLEEGKTAEGLAYLVRAGRTDPANHLVGTRLMAELGFRSFALPVGEPLKHPAKIEWAGVSKDGKRCLSSQDRRILHYWDWEHGKVLHVIDAGDRFVALAWDSENRKAATSTRDGLVRVWDLESGRILVGPLEGGPRASHTGMAFSPDGRWLAAGGAPAKVWNLSTGLRMESNNKVYSNRVAFSSDSTRYLTWNYGGDWRVWNVPDGTPITPAMRATPVEREQGSSGFHPGGRLLAIADSPTSMRFYDAATGAALGPKLEHDLRVYSSAFSDDGTKFATVSLDQTARVWEVPSGKPLLSPLAQGEPARGVRFTPDGRYLVVSSREPTTRVWDLATGQLAIEPWPVRFPGAVLENGDLVTATGNLVVRWRVEPRAIVPQPFAPDAERTYVRLNSGRRSAWTFFTDRMQETDILSGKQIGQPRRFPVAATPHLLSPDARHLLVTVTESKAQELWDFAGSDVVRRTLGTHEVRHNAFSPDSSRLILVYRGDEGRSTVRVWSSEDGQTLGDPFELPGGAVNGSAWSPDGRSLAVASTSGYTIAWEIASKKVHGTLLSDASVITVAYSPDGRLIAAGGFVGNVQIASASTLQPVGEAMELGEVAEGLTFTRDSRRLLTRTRWAVRMWDVATRAPLTEPMRQPFGSKDPLVGAAFSEDQSLIATWSLQGEVRLWDSRSGAMVVGPIRFGRAVRWVVFLSADRFLAAPHQNGGFSICPLPTCRDGDRTPGWLLRLAENLAGGVIDTRASFRSQALQVEFFSDIRRELAALPDDAPFVEWGRWFLSDSPTRPIAPGFTITPAEANKLRTEFAAPPPATATTSSNP